MRHGFFGGTSPFSRPSEFTGNACSYIMMPIRVDPMSLLDREVTETGCLLPRQRQARACCAQQGVATPIGGLTHPPPCLPLILRAPVCEGGREGVFCSADCLLLLCAGLYVCPATMLLVQVWALLHLYGTEMQLLVT
jgi:hypothetical protein